jgi:hypothetical protein
MHPGADSEYFVWLNLFTIKLFGYMVINGIGHAIE